MAGLNTYNTENFTPVFNNQQRIHVSAKNLVALLKRLPIGLKVSGEGYFQNFCPLHIFAFLPAEDSTGSSALQYRLCNFSTTS